MTYSPIAKAASYAMRGFSPIPILKGKKVPGYASWGNAIPMTGWDRFCKKQPTLAEMASWLADDPEAGLGLACGYGGVFPLDVDDSRAFGACKEVLGHLKAPSKIGRKGATGFFYDPTGLIESFVFRAKADEDGKRPNLIEGLGIGRQTVIPPTIHPDTGKPYRWHNAGLEDLTPADLPVITMQHIADLKAALAPHMEPERESPISATERKADITEMERKRYKGFAHKALDAEVSRLAMQPKPGRNRELFRATCNLGKYASNGILPAKVITDSLLAACERNKLKADNGFIDVMKTIQKGFAFSAGDVLPALQERPWP